MDMLIISTVLTVITSGGNTMPAGYQEITTAKASCADHIDAVMKIAAIDNAEADAYCLHSVTSVRPQARP